MDLITNPLFWGIVMSIAGGGTRAVVGYLSSDDGFKPKRFIRTMLTTTIGGLALVAGLATEATPKDLLLLYLGVMGIDTLASKVRPTE